MGYFFEVDRPYLNAILIGFGGFIIANIVAQLLARLLNKSMGSAWSRFLGSLAGLAVVIWTVKLILETAGAAGFVVVLVTAIMGAFALGSERLAGDLVAGVSFFSRIYTDGDFVHIAGYEGRVVNTSLILTTLESVHGDLLYIRNSGVTSGTITNYSVQPGHLVSVKLILPVNQDLNVAVTEIEKAIRGFSPAIEMTKETYKPKVVVETAAFGYVTVEARAYVPEMLDCGTEKTRIYLLAANAMTNAGLTLAL